MLILLSKGVPTKLLKFLWLKIFFICNRCQRHRWSTLSCEYLRDFWKKFEIVLMGYSGAGGKLIHKKNQKQKNLVTLSLYAIVDAFKWKNAAVVILLLPTPYFLTNSEILPPGATATDPTWADSGRSPSPDQQHPQLRPPPQPPQLRPPPQSPQLRPPLYSRCPLQPLAWPDMRPDLAPILRL